MSGAEPTMSGTKPDMDHVEQGSNTSTDDLAKSQPVKLSKRQKVKRHCARFWWLHLIIFAACSLIIILPIIYVAYPKIAQDDVNKSTILNTAQIVMDPSAERLNLTIDGTLETTSIFHPTLRPFNASLYLEGSKEPFISFTVPSIHAKNGTTFTVSQFVEVANLGELTTYSEFLLALEKFNVQLLGHGNLKLGGLPTVGINYNQTIEIKGLNALKGLEVTQLTLAADQPFNGNAYGTVMLPNPSVSTLTLGNVSLAMMVGTTPIGNTTLPDLVLAPGNQSYPLYASINQTAILGLLSQPAYQCGVFPLSLKGNTSVYDGEVVPYFTSALGLSLLSTTLNATTTLQEAGLGSLIKGACS